MHRLSSSFSWDTVLTKEQMRRFPSFCDGAERINTYVLGWCVVTLVAPLGIVLPFLLSNDYSDDTSLTLWIVFIACIVLGCGFCCWRLSPVYFGGLCCAPASTPKTHPFMNDEPVVRVPLKRLGLIVNPLSGNKKGVRIVSDILRPVFEDEFGIEVKVFETEYAGHAVVLAETIDTSKLDGLVVAGGDGSFHEVVNGMMRRTDGSAVPIGLIPSGTGNAVGHSLGLFKTRLAQAARRIARGEVYHMDVNRVKFKPNPHARSVVKFSAMTICWGLVGDIGVAAELHRNETIGKYAHAAWVGFKAKPEKVTITISGGDLDEPITFNQNLMTAFIQNTPHFGEGYYVVPSAKLDDGCMDIAILEQAHRGELLKTFTQLPRGAHTGNRKIQTYRIQKAVIVPASSPGLINIDGEVIPFDGPITVSTIPHALSIFVASDSHLPDADLPEPGPITGKSKVKGKGNGKGKGKAAKAIKAAKTKAKATKATKATKVTKAAKGKKRTEPESYDSYYSA
ncbi:diacylglycerol kinase catalytic region [Thecamonas trahens ATCC 50062]|uniref:Diacylglycerol kinase catalytic region n=1 Tax=Thecamonas trahens ATCC 50062 TaxID=461836 RepID=A0A0L0D660_THETB|nr:diacylglycerol kinase catalytic region [Thecamonas trahens ATCC 50062]KNC47872.1 diacylglycerol kinase catalytic region [Thecamonas trahens ATCC 50062]|eukprot:XP_013759350.1 diacylglycerol kinase catalytic region [Thecamonas trahens ATCC 50062]